MGVGYISRMVDRVGWVHTLGPISPQTVGGKCGSELRYTLDISRNPQKPVFDNFIVAPTFTLLPLLPAF